jgi:formate-dependent nitrite reductase membrane component NrfD
MKQIEWGFLIINYLFLGGLSAGLYFLSGIATLLGTDENSRLKTIARRGALLAPWPVMLGTFLLVFDLGNWFRFYKLMLHFRWTSPMSIGTWLLMFFTVFSLLYLWSSLEPAERASLLSRLPNRLRWISLFDYDLKPWRRTLGLTGLPLSVGVGIYTGVLLGAVQSRPFWNTNLVAQLFLVSALSTGCAMLMLALLWFKESTPEEMQFLFIADVVFLLLETFIVLPYVIHGELSVQPVKDALHLIMGGQFTMVFWVCFVGIGLLLPLVIELYEVFPVLIKNSGFKFDAKMVTVTAVLVLLGGYMLRYIFVYAGQISRFD